MRVHIPIDKERLAPGEVVPAELTVIADDLTLLVQQGTSSEVTVDTLITGRDLITASDQPVTTWRLTMIAGSRDDKWLGVPEAN